MQVEKRRDANTSETFWVVVHKKRVLFKDWSESMCENWLATHPVLPEPQCTPCSVDAPYEKTIQAGGVLCGGCGRRKPSTTYRLASVDAVSGEVLDALEVLFQWSRSYADSGDTWDATKEQEPNTLALHAMIERAAAVEQLLGWQDGIKPSVVQEGCSDE